MSWSVDAWAAGNGTAKGLAADLPPRRSLPVLRARGGGGELPLRLQCLACPPPPVPPPSRQQSLGPPTAASADAEVPSHPGQGLARLTSLGLSGGRRRCHHKGPPSPHAPPRPGCLSGRDAFERLALVGEEGGWPPFQGCIRGEGASEVAQRLDGQLEEVAKAVGGGYCRLQLPLTLVLGVRGTVARHRLAALEGGWGVPPPTSNASVRVTPRLDPDFIVGQNEIYKRQQWFGPFVVHTLLGSRTPPPLSSSTSLRMATDDPQ